MTVLLTACGSYLGRSFLRSFLLDHRPPLSSLTTTLHLAHLSQSRPLGYPPSTGPSAVRLIRSLTMHITTFLPLAVLFVSFLHVSMVQGKCCNPDAGGDCGDNSAGTPCCGYHKCNGFCCACEGVQIIRQPVDVRSGTKHLTTTSVITAPPWTTWTCREDHITKDPPTVRDVASATATVIGIPSPIVTAASVFRDRPSGPGYQGPPQPAAECDDILMRVSGGSGKVTLEQYLHFFNASEDNNPRKSVITDMFHNRDVDGNGVLTKDEIEVML